MVPYQRGASRDTIASLADEFVRGHSLSFERHMTNIDYVFSCPTLNASTCPGSPSERFQEECMDLWERVDIAKGRHCVHQIK